jgi:uncharacterized protein (DUF2235 family)
MAVRVSITCKSGDMFSHTLPVELYQAYRRLYLELEDGIELHAFGRSFTVKAQDVAEINIKEIT